MKIFKTILLVTFLSFISNNIIAVTAKPGYTQYTQPDGSALTIGVRGDEYIHWAVSIDGYTLLPNEMGTYEYALVSIEGKLLPSGIKANNPENRSFKELSFLKTINTRLFYSSKQVIEIKEKCPINNHYGSKMGGFPTTGNNKLLLILANFNNTTTTYTQAQFDNYMNQANYNGIGSFKDFYLQNSYNLLNVNSIVTIWVTVPNTHNYYGPEAKWAEFVRDAVNAADVAGIDFSQFDNDNDGDVDGVAVIHQGRGQEESGSTTDIWSHNFNLTNGGFSGIYKDGKFVNDYTCQPEKNGSSMSTIGVMCHEFGHNLGAPDFYDTDYSTNGNYTGTGNWDIMAGGSWNGGGAHPAMHNAWTKEFYNWITPTVITSNGNNHQIRNAENFQDAFKFYTPTSSEYYLMENRQLIGFDQGLPGHGLLIYHVDGNYINSHMFSNNINTGSHQGLYPVCSNASGNPSGTYGNINSGGCPYPGNSGKTSFTDATTPWAKSWALENTLTPITNITESNQLITFNVTFSGSLLPVVDFSTGGWYNINEGGFIDFYDNSLHDPTNWTWTFDGGTPSNSTIQHPAHIVYNNAGSYNVTLTANNPYGSGTLTKTNYINVNPVGINTFSEVNNINITPNPNIGIFTLSINSSQKEELNISICNILGIEIFKTTIYKSQENLNTNINLPYITNGLYYISINSHEKVTTKQLLICK